MQALNASAEYQSYANVIRSMGITPPTEAEHIEYNVRVGAWIEDDGDYYTAEEWATQYDEPCDHLHLKETWVVDRSANVCKTCGAVDPE